MGPEGSGVGAGGTARRAEGYRHRRLEQGGGHKFDPPSGLLPAWVDVVTYGGPQG
jgi:hypothetical protein